MTAVGLSLSGGASSLWALAMIAAGELDRPTHFAVFFADTGDEHEWTYETIDRAAAICVDLGVPFFRGSHRTMLWDDVEAATRGERKRIDTPPLWTENQGGGRGQLTQQCSQIYKSRVVRRMQSMWLESAGLPKRITTWIGFGADEQHRATKAIAKQEVQWATLDFPAIHVGAGRAQQRADLMRVLGWMPRFSMCRRCPYKSVDRWQQTTVADLSCALDTDERIRHGLEAIGVDNPCYLTDRLIPLRQLIERGDPQPDLPGFESHCDGGMCFV